MPVVPMPFVLYSRSVPDPDPVDPSEYFDQWIRILTKVKIFALEKSFL